MCVAAFPAIGGLAAGTQSALFAASLGLTAANAFAQRSAAQSAANQTYNQALIAQQSAEDSKRLQQQALAEQKSETEKSKAQDIFAKNIEALQASRSIIASEQAGTTIGLLLMDQERQAANYRESVNQSLESYRRQYETTSSFTFYVDENYDIIIMTEPLFFKYLLEPLLFSNFL